MPWVTINMLSGHSNDKKKKLHAEVTKAVSNALDIPLEWVRIQLVEMQDVDNSVGGITIEDMNKK